mmetsp:Transcript_20301/g.48350  ORF Transcript_20301/g.48350 Transcript_20301/m.48350 type:complete len:206 (-) Transcript_20301:264-881(-)
MTQRRKTQERSGGLRVVVQDTGRVKNRMSKNQTLNVANRVVKRQQTPIKSGKRISNAKVSRRALTLSERFSQIENKRRELSKSSLAAQEIKPRRAVGRISQLGAKQATVTPKRNDGRGKPRVLTVRRNPQSTGNESCGLSFKIQILSERFSAPTLYSFLIVQFSNRKRPSKYATPKQTVRRFQGTQYSAERASEEREGKTSEQSC